MQDSYPGIDKDDNGGMTNIGKIIRDGWLFDLIDESETCAGWSVFALDRLLDDVNEQWDKYGCMISNLPEELANKHQRLYQEAVKRARDAGWSGELEVENDD